MANNVINTRIQQRYDSFDNWKNQNPILLVGEVANVRFADETVRTKTGNGTSAFNSLPWDDKNLYQGNSSTVNIFDGNISWGGENKERSFSPIDAAMVSELGANRFAFMPAEAIEVEYSKDGGTTWLDYGATNEQKISCFSSLGATFISGKASNSNPATADDQLRITLTQNKANLYTQFNKFVFLISTNGSLRCKVTIQGLLGKNLTDDTAYQTIVENIPINGWSGYNVINDLPSNVIFGPNGSHYGKLRFIFTNEGHDTLSPNNAGLIIHSIYGFGGVGWMTPSNLAKFGHLYNWNAWKDAIFPNNVKTDVAPTSSNDLTNKKYVDEKVENLTEATLTEVSLTASDMTGSGCTISDYRNNINATITQDGTFTIQLNAQQNGTFSYSINDTMNLTRLTVYTDENDTTGTLLSKAEGIYQGYIYKITGYVVRAIMGTVLTFSIKTLQGTAGLMSGNDKLTLSNLQIQVGDISTALDSILTIQNNLLGGNS